MRFGSHRRISLVMFVFCNHCLLFAIQLYLNIMSKGKPFFIWSITVILILSFQLLHQNHFKEIPIYLPYLISNITKKALKRLDFHKIHDYHVKGSRQFNFVFDLKHISFFLFQSQFDYLFSWLFVLYPFKCVQSVKNTRSTTKTFSLKSCK